MSGIRRPKSQRGFTIGSLVFLGVAITACSDTGGSEQTTSTSGPSATTTTQPGPAQTTTTTAPTPGTVPDIPLVPPEELPVDFPQIPVPAGGEPVELGVFEGEPVGYQYPAGTLPTLVAFYEAWLPTVGIDPRAIGPRYKWRGELEGMRVDIDVYQTSDGLHDELVIIYYP